MFAADKTMVSRLSYLPQIHHHSSGYLTCVFAVFSKQSDRTGGILLSYAHSTGQQDVEEHLLLTFFLFSCNCDLTLFRNSNQCLAPRELLPLTEMSQWCFPRGASRYHLLLLLFQPLVFIARQKGEPTSFIAFGCWALRKPVA